MPVEAVVAVTEMILLEVQVEREAEEQVEVHLFPLLLELQIVAEVEAQPVEINHRELAQMAVQAS
jgi:hypothetical protein